MRANYLGHLFMGPTFERQTFVHPWTLQLQEEQEDPHKALATG
jgi:hypothetical protein